MSDKLHNLLRLLGLALTRLDGALAQPVNEFVRDSAIQRFEFTFELDWIKLCKKAARLCWMVPPAMIRTWNR